MCSTIWLVQRMFLRSLSEVIIRWKEDLIENWVAYLTYTKENTVSGIWIHFQEFLGKPYKLNIFWKRLFLSTHFFIEPKDHCTASVSEKV